MRAPHTVKRWELERLYYELAQKAQDYRAHVERGEGVQADGCVEDMVTMIEKTARTAGP